MGYIIIYRRYRNRVAEMLRGFFYDSIIIYFRTYVSKKKREK